MYEGQITTNFHNKWVPFNKKVEATAMLKVGSVYNQGHNYYPQTFVVECKYREVINSCTNFLSDSDDENLSDA